MNPSRRRTLGLIALGLGLALDQVSKHWALGALSPGVTLTLPGPLDFTLIYNHSNSFGVVPIVGEATRWGLAALNILVGAALIWTLVRRTPNALTCLGLGLICAGALGNGIDRLWLGAVVDFLDASKLGFVWVFNAADALLDAGILAALLGAFSPRAARA